MLELQTANKNKKTKNGGGDGITALYCRLSVDDNGTEAKATVSKIREIFSGGMRNNTDTEILNIISTTVTAERISIVRIFRE